MAPTLKDETIILQVEADRPIIYTPKRLKWNEITVPTEFQIVPRNLERTKVEDIIEEPDGKILLKFPSFRERPSTSRHSWLLARRSSYESIDFNSPIEQIQPSSLEPQFQK